MKKILFAFLFVPFAAFANPTDSIGIKKVGEKWFVLHKVDQGQTVSGIARKYKTNLSAIQKANEGMNLDRVNVGATILIPSNYVESRSSQVLTVPKVANSTDKINESKDLTKYHTVEPGETLFKIASLYNVKVDEIKKWNNLTTDNLNVGQKIAISLPTAMTAIETKSNPVEAIEKKPETPKVEAPMPTVEKTITAETPKAITNKDVIGNPSTENLPITNAKSVRTVGDEIIESGHVTISSDGDLAQERNFVIHSNAKIGTIVMISNPENNKSAFARVVGNSKLPTNQVLIINPTLSKKLGISDNQKNVKVNYAK